MATKIYGLIDNETAFTF